MRKGKILFLSLDTHQPKIRKYGNRNPGRRFALTVDAGIEVLMEKGDWERSG